MNRLRTGTRCCEWWNLLILVLAVAFVPVECLGAAKAFGGLTARTTLTPTDVAVSTSFEGSYFTGVVAELSRSFLTSIPALAENAMVSTGSGFQVALPSPTGTSFVQFFAYHKQDIVLDWPVGVWGVVSELAFSWDMRRHYLWSHAWLHYGGVELKLKAALARADAAVGSGMEVGFEGTTLRGLVLSITLQFGLTADRTALVEAVSEGRVGGEMFEYRGTTLAAGVFPLCCLSLDATVRLTKRGFKSLQIVTDYEFTLAEVDVTASATVLFETEEKALAIVPRLVVLFETDSEIYLYLFCSLLPASLGPSSPAITGIRLDEAGLSGLTLGEVRLSGRYTFSGTVYRGPLQGLPRYDLVLSLQRSTLETELGLNLYFAAEGSYLLGLGLVTFQAQVTVLSDFVATLNVDVTTDAGWKRIAFQLNYTFHLYGL